MDNFIYDIPTKLYFGRDQNRPSARTSQGQGPARPPGLRWWLY